MIKQTKPNNLTLPDLQNMCFWWRYKVLKKSKKIERAIFAGLSHSRGTEPNFAGSKWRRSIAAGLTFEGLPDQGNARDDGVADKLVQSSLRRIPHKAKPRCIDAELYRKKGENGENR